MVGQELLEEVPLILEEDPLVVEEDLLVVVVEELEEAEE